MSMFMCVNGETYWIKSQSDPLILTVGVDIDISQDYVLCD